MAPKGAWHTLRMPCVRECVFARVYACVHVHVLCLAELGLKTLAFGPRAQRMVPKCIWVRLDPRCTGIIVYFTRIPPTHCSCRVGDGV